MRSLIPTALAAALLVPATAGAAVSPPEPTGPAPVGFTRTTLTDHHRTEPFLPGGGPRRIPLRVWYPASRPGAAPAPVFTPPEQQAWEALFGLPEHALDGTAGNTTAGAPPAPGRHPVLLLSHGGGLSTAFHTAQATELASRGYVVVGVDHPGDASAVDLGGGNVAPAVPVAGRFDAKGSIPVRTADLRHVLARLGRLRGAGRLDRSRVGAFGHSRGGVAVANALYADKRLDAGVLLDSSPQGPVTRHGVDKPLGILAGDRPLAQDVRLAELRRHLRGPRPFAQWRDHGHNAFNDQVWLVPHFGADPVEEEVGTVDAAAAVRRQRAWLVRFFDRHLLRREG
jgi:predicted dienelactone hydrolase